MARVKKNILFGFEKKEAMIKELRMLLHEEFIHKVSNIFLSNNAFWAPFSLIFA